MTVQTTDLAKNIDSLADAPQWEQTAYMKSLPRRQRARQKASKPKAVFQATVIEPKPPVVLGEVSNDVWYRLRLCESGGNYATNSGNGFYGAYQFMLSTWQAVGGQGYPHEASPAEQDKRAQILASRSNPYTQWPVCWPKAVQN